MKKTVAAAVIAGVFALISLSPMKALAHDKHYVYSSEGTWGVQTQNPAFINGAGAQLLLTDGSVLAFEYNFPNNNNVWRLVPDQNGSYISGTWSQVAAFPASANTLYRASAVLADGRVIIAGGEYGDPNYDYLASNLVAIYDPVADSWTTIAPPLFFDVNSNIVDLFAFLGTTPYPNFNPIVDAQSVILADGRFMLADSVSNKAAILDLETLEWISTGKGKIGNYHEEGWTLLPNEKVLTVNCYVGSTYPAMPTGAQLYDPCTGRWGEESSTIVPLAAVTDDSGSFPYPDREMGPAVLRPNGTVLAMGAAGNSSIYDVRSNRWSVGPTLPLDPTTGFQVALYDAPATLLPNGNVLLAASPNDSLGNYYPGLSFWEFNGKSFVPENNLPDAAGSLGFFINFLVLPNGEIMSMSTEDGLVAFYTSQVGKPLNKWKPKITHCHKKLSAGQTYKIEGIRFNGMSQGASYGDDYQSATNYPIVRLTNPGTGHVFYCRTHDHSYMGVASDKLVYTYFDVPANVETGNLKLEVVANGIASKPLEVQIR